MIVKCITNQESDVGHNLRSFSLTQIDGILDITPGYHYAVYSIKRNELGTWYFVHTDTINQRTFWWMPSIIYKTIDGTIPNEWQTKILDNDDEITGYSSLFFWEVEEGIIDGENWALDKFVKQVNNDFSFPSAEKLIELNAKNDFQKERKLKIEYKSNGWEYLKDSDGFKN